MTQIIARISHEFGIEPSKLISELVDIEISDWWDRTRLDMAALEALDDMREGAKSPDGREGKPMSARDRIRQKRQKRWRTLRGRSSR